MTDAVDIKKEVRKQVSAAIKFAKLSPYPKESTLLKGVYA